MSGFIPFATGATPQARNPQRTYEKLLTASEALQLTGSGTANNIGTYQSLNTPSNNLSGIILTVGSVSVNSARYQINLRAGGSTIIVPDLHFQLTTTAYIKVRIPIKIAASTTLDIGVRSSASSGTCRVHAEGIIANSLDSPGFDNMEAVSVATGSTRPHATDIPNTDTWTDLIASTAHTYGAMLFSVGDNGSAPATGYRDEIAIGLWNGSSYDEIFTDYVNAQTSSPYVHGGNLALYEGNIPSGSKIGVKLNTASANSDNLRVGSYGFY